MAVTDEADQAVKAMLPVPASSVASKEIWQAARTAGTQSHRCGTFSPKRRRLSDGLTVHTASGNPTTTDGREDGELYTGTRRRKDPTVQMTERL